MQLASLGYRTDLMLLRLQGSVIEVARDHLVVRTPANPGFHWGNFVLAGQSWVDRPLADLVAVFHAEHPAAHHVAIGVDGVDGRVWGHDELGECGLEVDRSVVMTATEVREPLHPNTDAVCRMLSSDADWAAAVDLHAVEHHEFEPAEYRDGLASTLVHHASMVGQRDFATRDLVMVADPDHGAIRIYRSLGFADSEIQIGLDRPSA